MYECRDIRHAWDYSGDQAIQKGRFHQRNKVVAFTRILICTRCGTVRYDTFTVIGTTLVRKTMKYKYPKDYTVPKGMRIEDIRY